MYSIGDSNVDAANAANEVTSAGSNGAPAAALTEAEAIRLAQAGDGEAFEFLYQMHCRRVYALCMRMTGNPAEAQDLTQDAFLQLFRKISSFRGESSFSTWLHRLTVNVVLMRFRRKRHPEVSLDEPAASGDDPTPLALEIGEPDLRVRGTLDRVMLDRAIKQLPAGYKVMFVLHDIQGYAHEEIAQILGCSIGNSKSQLHKARLRMRELLTSRIRRARRKRTAKAGRTSGAAVGLKWPAPSGA
jgi:RNA polymerase sigma-70 factor (ECF subfamily)